MPIYVRMHQREISKGTSIGWHTGREPPRDHHPCSHHDCPCFSASDYLRLPLLLLQVERFSRICPSAFVAVVHGSVTIYFLDQ